MFVAVATRTMASAKFKVAPPSDIVVRSIGEIRAEKRAERIRAWRESPEWEVLRAQRRVANDAIRRANEALRDVRGADACIQSIVQRICRATKVKPQHIFSPTRARHVVFARQAICYWARRLSGLSLPQIGDELGNRDHTTILHGVRAYPEKRALMGRTLRSVR